jgi:hypothetical protein
LPQSAIRGVAQFLVGRAHGGDRLLAVRRRVADCDRLEHEHDRVELAQLARVQPCGTEGAAGHRFEQALALERGQGLRRGLGGDAGAARHLLGRRGAGVAEQPGEQPRVDRGRRSHVRILSGSQRVGH